MRDDVVTFFSPILLLSTHLYILIASLSRRLGGQKNVVWPNDDDDFDDDFLSVQHPSDQHHKRFEQHQSRDYSWDFASTKEGPS